MAIKSALDFQAIDKTWDMLANMRYPFGNGVLEVSDATKRGYISQLTSDQGSGIISIAPFSAVTSQGVVLWNEDVTKVSVGQSGTFYIALYAVRGESSHLTVQFEAKASVPTGDSYIVFGMVTMSAGNLTSVSYENKQSLGQVGHMKFKGIVSSLPDLNPGGDIEGSKASADVQHGDVFVTVNGDKAYLHVVDKVNKVYRVITAGSTIANQNCWGSGANQVCIDGNNGTVLAGSGANKIELRGLQGLITAKRVTTTEVVESAALKTTSLQSQMGNDIILGVPNPANSAYLIPVTNGNGGLGKTDRYFATAYVNSLTSIYVRAKNTSISAVGTAGQPFRYVRTKQIDAGGSGPLLLGDSVEPTQDGTYNVGSDAKALGSQYVNYLRGRWKHPTSVYGQRNNLIIEADNILPTRDTPDQPGSDGVLGASHQRWRALWVGYAYADAFRDSRTLVTMGEWRYVPVGLDDSITNGIGVLFLGGAPATVYTDSADSYVQWLWHGGQTITLQGVIKVDCSTTPTHGIYIIPKGNFTWAKPPMTAPISRWVGHGTAESSEEGISGTLPISVVAMDSFGGCISARYLNNVWLNFNGRIRFSITYNCIGHIQGNLY